LGFRTFRHGFKNGSMNSSLHSIRLHKVLVLAPSASVRNWADPHRDVRDDRDRPDRQPKLGRLVLRLDSEGFELKSFLSRRKTKWQDVKAFRLAGTWICLIACPTEPNQLPLCGRAPRPLDRQLRVDSSSWRLVRAAVLPGPAPPWMDPFARACPSDQTVRSRHE
jgi:hypothetical protein